MSGGRPHSVFRFTARVRRCRLELPLAVADPRQLRLQPDDRVLETLAGRIARTRQRFVVVEQQLLLVREPKNGVQVRDVIESPFDAGDDLALLGLVEAVLGVRLRDRDPAAEIASAEPGKRLGQGDPARLGPDARFHATERLADVERRVRQRSYLGNALPCGLVPGLGSQQGGVVLDGAVQAASEVRFRGVRIGPGIRLDSFGGCQARRQHSGYGEGS